MFQTPDYTILDHLTETCEVVDFNFRYLYVNQAAAKRKHLSRDEMLGRTILELHPTAEASAIISHLNECMDEQKSIEFEDASSNQKFKIEPVPEGAFIHSVGQPAHNAKVKVRKKAISAFVTDGYPRHPIEKSLSYDRIIKEQSKTLEIEGWLDSLDSRTRETNEHILRVTEATVALARAAGLPERDIVLIRQGALLHDIGKTGVPDAILLKSGSLTDEEWEVIRKHPVYAYDLFYPVEHLRNSLSIPYAHHERWDGTGYPQGLAGEQIPLSARLFAVIDVWDTLSFDRVYRKAWSHKKVMEYIEQQSGSQFDPEVVNLFFQVTGNLIKLFPR